jgi:hypothetical protein
VHVEKEILKNRRRGCGKSVNKRFCKKQQMQWSREGAHLLLQNRTKTLNRELAQTFRNWYPEFICADGEKGDGLARAA